MKGPLAALAITITIVICNRSEACSSLYHRDVPAAPSVEKEEERLEFPTMATTRITGVTFAGRETTTKPYVDCATDPCDRGRFCSRHNFCHSMDDACYVGELPPYRMCHDLRNAWCRFQLEPKDKTACGILRPKSLNSLGWSVTEGTGAYQKRLEKLRRRQESQMKQMCQLLPIKKEGWIQWCNEETKG